MRGDQVGEPQLPEGQSCRHPEGPRAKLAQGQQECSSSCQVVSSPPLGACEQQHHVLEKGLWQCAGVDVTY